MPSQTRIQSVSRAVRILMAIAASDEGLPVKAITQTFDLSPPTAYHLLNTLVDEGLLVKNDRRLYLLGPTASVIAEAYTRQSAIPERYLEALHTLSASTGETAYLSGWRNGNVTVLASMEGTDAVRVAGLSVGYTEHIHARASGKLLLAHVSDEIRDSLLNRGPLVKVTSHTLTSRRALDREFEQIRREGVAYDRQEFRDGVACASAPIYDNGSVVMCLTLASPAGRFAERHDEFIDALKAAARSAS